MRPNWVTPWFLQTSPFFSFLSFSSSPPAVYWNPTHNSRTTFTVHITEAWRWSSPILIPFLLLTAYLYWNFWSILSGFPYKIFSWPSIMWVLQLSLFYRWVSWGFEKISQPIQSYLANKWQSWDLTPDLCNTKLHASSHGGTHRSHS